jgi:DNA-directed RNA polymerase specialized sigma24 family protein
VDAILHDAPIAAALLEEVANRVSARLQAKPAVAQNLGGYLIRAFHRRVRREFDKNNRIAYEGLLRELEAKHSLLASDWATAMEWELFIDHLTALMPSNAQRIVHYRLLAFDWEEISDAMGISITQARSKYYYGVTAAYETLLTNAARRRKRGN